MADIAKERAIRERIEGLYNRPEDDFATREEYDDYLEQREDLIFNLTEGIDVAECEKKLVRYAEDNASSIAAHAAVAAERARLADKATEGEQQPETTAATATAGAAVPPPPPPMFNQPPPMPLGLPPEPMNTTEATMTEATTGEATGTTAAPPPAPFASSGGAPKTPLDYLRMGAASGWEAKGARRRGIAEAFRSLFAF